MTREEEGEGGGKKASALSEDSPSAHITAKAGERKRMNRDTQTHKWTDEIGGGENVYILKDGVFIRYLYD